MPFVSDTFTDTDSTALGSHTGEVGATWTEHPNQLGVDPTIVSNELNSGSTTGNIWYASGLPATSEYDVQFTNRATTSAGVGVGPYGRLLTSAVTGYLAWGAGNTTLYKVSAGAFTSLGTYASTWVAGDVIVLRIRNGSKELVINDVVRVTSANNDITGSGRAGFRTYQSGGKFDNFIATDVPFKKYCFSVSQAINRAGTY